jgi:Ca-activated chloride channel family protein
MFNTSLLAEFHFLRPEWFLALIPVIVILALLRFEKKSQGDWQQIIPKHLLKHLLHEKQGSSSNAAFSLLSAIWLLSIIALAGPTWERVSQPVYEKIEARVYVLDLSYSMYSGDLKPNRIVRARLKLIDLLNAKREGLSALVVFSGDAYVVTPLTNDVNTIVSLIPALEPKIMPNVGSNAKEGVLKALELLANTKVENGKVILLSDEVLLNDRQNINAMMESSPYKLSILGIGTSNGAPIKLPNGQFLKDKSGAIVIPKLNEAELKNLANDNKGRYVTLRQDNKDVRYIHQENNIEASNESRESQQNFDLWLEAGQWLMFPILLLAAFSFRKGWLLAFFICFNFIASPENAYAAETAVQQENKNQQNVTEASRFEKITDTWQSLWKTGDQRGIASMKAQDFSNAAKQFNNKDWKASAHYYNGQFAQAAELFNPDNQASKVKQSDTWYNRGNALARAGDLNGAIKAYDKSLGLNPENEDAEFNKKLVEDLKNNVSENQQNEQQEKQEKNKDQQKTQDSEQTSDDSSQDNNSQQQDSEQHDSQKQDSQKQGSQDKSSEQKDSNQSQNQEQPSDSQSDNQSSEKEGQSEQGNSENSENKNQENNTSESDSPEASEEEKQSPETQEQSAQQSGNENVSENEQGNKQTLSPLDREKQQALEQWLRQVPDDPSGLMRRKFEIENMRRKNTTNNQQQAW